MRADTPAPALGGSPEQVREGYLSALLGSDLAAARSVLDDAIAAGMPVRRIYLDVLQPTLALRGLDPAPYVLVGGQAFGGSAERALRTGADAFAVDAEAAATAARARFGTSP
jgi:hypothetical protein